MQERLESLMFAGIEEEKALVREVLEGREIAFEHFFEAYFPRVYRFALSRLKGDAFLAEDVAQETLIKAMKYLHSWRGEASVFVWLCTIARRQMIDLANKNQREPATDFANSDDDLTMILESLAVNGPDDFDERLHSDHLSDLVQTVLDYLPPRYGDCLELMYIQGLTMKEISQRMDTSPKAVESLLSRARQAFRDALVVVTGDAQAGGLLS